MQRVQKKNVKKALELIRLSKKRMQKSKMKTKAFKELENTQCKIMHSYKKSERQFAKGFSKQRVLLEIKAHANQRAWGKVKDLFLLLLHMITDIEPLIWRYSFILVLYGNVDNISNIYYFFQACISSSHSDSLLILKNMLSLKFCK